MKTRSPGEQEQLALLQGTLDVLILRTLRFGPQHGQGIARAIQETSEDVLLVDHTHADFSAEVQAHLDLETGRLIAEGMSAGAARAAARRAFAT